MEKLGISALDLAVNVGVELIAAFLLALGGAAFALTMRGRNNITRIADFMIALAELSKRIAANTLPNSKSGGANADVKRVFYIFEYELGAFEKQVQSVSRSLSPKQQEKLESFIDASNHFVGVVEHGVNRDQSFWRAYGGIFMAASAASKLLHRRGGGRKARIKALHDVMTQNGGAEASSVADGIPRKKLQEVAEI